MKLHFTGEAPARFYEAVAELAPLVGIEVCGVGVEAEASDGEIDAETCDRGVEVTLVRASGPTVIRHGDKITLGWAKPVHLYRALSLLCQAWDREDYERSEMPYFETGFMIDASRNAVPSPEALKGVFRKMALMGMDCGMMYTEDTYEIPEYPYFGYMRGRYSQAELRELDDYADMLGIELIPFIQTLGHLNRALHWPKMQRFMDNGEVLLADDEPTCDFIRAMLRAASEPYRTRRIHIGMDEAHGIGLGNHLRVHGFEDPHAIIRRHLLRVRDMAVEMGLTPMMWGDMFFRPDSPTGAYYDTGDPSPESVASAVPGVEIMYWDYYHNTKAEYAAMIEKHKKLTDRVLFAGGIWTWTGPAPDYDKTVTASSAGLAAAKEAGIPFCVGCAWGDNGAEANLLTAIAGMQLYAEFGYTGSYDEKWLAERFRVCCGGKLRQFYGLSRFNTVPGMRSTALRPVNAAKFLLYQDPMVQLYAQDTSGLEMAAHFDRLAEEYAGYAAEGGEYSLLMAFYAQLARVLAGKCRWHEASIPAVRAGDREKVRALAAGLKETQSEAELLRRLWRTLWDSTNKPFGFEIIDGRLGAVCARLDTARERALCWADGGDETLPELFETVLPYTRQEGGALFGSYAVGEIVSACKIDI